MEIKKYSQKICSPWTHLVIFLLIQHSTIVAKYMLARNLKRQGKANHFCTKKQSLSSSQSIHGVIILQLSTQLILHSGCCISSYHTTIDLYGQATLVTTMNRCIIFLTHQIELLRFTVCKYTHCNMLNLRKAK